jgi:hypothetical protein
MTPVTKTTVPLPGREQNSAVAKRMFGTSEESMGRTSGESDSYLDQTVPELTKRTKKLGVSGHWANRKDQQDSADAERDVT